MSRCECREANVVKTFCLVPELAEALAELRY